MLPSMQSITAIRQAKRNLRLPRQTLDRLRDDLLQRQVATAYEKVAFYRKLYNDANVSPRDIKTAADLWKLPIITKSSIRNNLTDFMNADFNKVQCYRSHTSGSTGEPTWTYYDRHCWYRKKYLSKLRARMACGMRWGQKVVILETEATRNLRLINRKLSRMFFLLPVKYLSIFEPPDKLLRQLYEINPHNLYGPPSCLFLLARQARQEHTTIPNLSRIFTSSEYLSESVRGCLRKSLNVQVYDVYGSTETKEMAWQCHMQDGYHVNEDEVIIEIVDNEGRVLPEDTPGNIVITDLRNQAMPLIRYRNSDKGLLNSKPCACGFSFRLMRPLGGRASEYIFLPDGRKISPFLFTTSIENVKGLLQYQIVQERPDALRIKTIFEEGFFRQGSAVIRSTLSTVTENRMTIEVEACRTISLEENGKLMVVRREINDESSSTGE